MEFFNFHTNTVKNPRFTQASPVAQATWLKVLCYCISVENRGRIQGAAHWKEATWMLTVGVSRKHVQASELLLFTEGDDILVWGFPQEVVDHVHRKRAQATGAARARWEAERRKANGPASANAGALLAHDASANASASADAMRDAMQRRGEERTGENSIPAHEQTDAFEREVMRTLPASFEAIPEFRDRWREWVSYAVERFKGLPPQATFDAHLRTLHELLSHAGPQAVLDSLRTAMARNLREPPGVEKIAGVIHAPTSPNPLTVAHPAGADPFAGGAYLPAAS